MSVRLAHAPTIHTLCVNIVWHILLHVHVFILTLNCQCSVVEVQGLWSTVNSAVDFEGITSTVAIDH